MRNAQTGQTLLEVVIATSLLIMALTVMVSAVATANANNRRSKERAIATRLVQSAQDWLRGQRDVLGWNTFSYTLSADEAYCLGDLSTIDLSLPNPLITATSVFNGPCAANADLVPPAQSSKTSYYRRLYITTDGSTTRNYKIEIYWYSGRTQVESVFVEGRLTEWQ
jgi:type II secretory pathway pseudopilin PulG